MNSPTRSTPYTVYLGVAAQDLAVDSTTLEIICTDITPGAASGTVGSGVTNINVSLKNRAGDPIKSTITSSNHVVATWEGQSNMKYPPLVRKGEPVEVYKIGDQDKFYWRTTGKGADFRTTDRVVFQVSATDPNKPGTSNDDSNSYTAYLDSHNKKVGFKTSTSNGEAVGMAVEADLSNGTFCVTDNSSSPGNRIFLDTGAKSGSPKFQVNIQSGATFLFDNEHCIIKVPKSIIIQSGERLVFDSPLTVMNINKIGNVIINTGSFALNTTKDAVFAVAGVIGLNAIATKVMGTLVSGATRVAKLAKGSLGGSYSPISLGDPLEGSVSESANSSDTDTSNIVTNLPVI